MTTTYFYNHLFLLQRISEHSTNNAIIRAYEKGVQQEHNSGARQLRRGPRLKKHLSVCY